MTIINYLMTYLQFLYAITEIRGSLTYLDFVYLQMNSLLNQSVSFSVDQHYVITTRSVILHTAGKYYQ